MDIRRKNHERRRKKSSQSLVNVFRLENRMNARRTCSNNWENGKSWMTSNRMYLLSLHPCNAAVLQLIIVEMCGWNALKMWEENPIEIFSNAMDQFEIVICGSSTTGWQVEYMDTTFGRYVSSEHADAFKPISIFQLLSWCCFFSFFGYGLHSF